MKAIGTRRFFLKRVSNPPPFQEGVSSLLKKGDWLRADRFLSGENAPCEVPVPFFQ